MAGERRGPGRPNKSGINWSDPAARNAYAADYRARNQRAINERERLRTGVKRLLARRKPRTEG